MVAMSVKLKTSVRAKLRNAYVTIAALSILAALIGFFFFAVVKDAQQTVTDNALPAARAAELLVQQGALLQSLGVSLLDAGAPAATDKISRKVEALHGEMRSQLLFIVDYAGLEGNKKAFSDGIDKIHETLVRERQLVDERNYLLKQERQLQAELLLATNRFLEMLHPAIVSSSTEVLTGIDGLRARIGAGGTGLDDVNSALDTFVIEVLQQNNALVAMRHEAVLFLDTLETMPLARTRQDVDRAGALLNLNIRTIARILSEWPRDEFRQEMGTQLRILANGLRGPENIIALQLKIVSTIESLDRLSDDLSGMVLDLSNAALNLKGEVDSSIGESVAEAQRAIFLGQAGLIVVMILAMAATAWVVIKYVMNDVAARIDALSGATTELSRGNLDVDVPVSGNDELSDIAQALGRFRHVAAELKRSNRDLEQFAYIASHDLKAPLRGIAHLGEWIEEDLGPDIDAEVKKHLELLKRRTERLTKLLDDLLQFSRAGRQKSHVRELDLQKFLKDLFSFVAVERPAVLNIDGRLPTITTAETALEQVFANLFSNALKHHDRGDCTVTVSYQRLSHCHRFQVSDDGPGIPKELRERVFGMFQTIKPRDELEASGMGLAVIKRILESVGCDITLESDQANRRGTTFVFTWPLAWPTALTEE